MISVVNTGGTSSSTTAQSVSPWDKAMAMLPLTSETKASRHTPNDVSHKPLFVELVVVEKVQGAADGFVVRKQRFWPRCGIRRRGGVR